MNDPGVALKGLEARGNIGRTADADHQVSGQALPCIAGSVPAGNAQQGYFIPAFFRRHVYDLFAIGALIVELAGRPVQVVVEFTSAGEEGLKIDEILQATLFEQIVGKGEMAAGVAQGGQVLQKGYLHVDAVQQHILVPGKVRLFFDKQRVDVMTALTLFFQRDGQCDIGGAEADADQIVNFHAVSFRSSMREG